MCSSADLEAGAPRPHRLRKEEGFVQCEGSALALPGFIAFRQNGRGTGGLRRPPFRTWIGALVASPRCHTLRPGLASISRFTPDCEKCLPKRPSAGYKYSCPGPAPLAGFEVATYGRFSGGRRGLWFNPAKLVTEFLFLDVLKTHDSPLRSRLWGDLVGQPENHQ
jgi:hypothetical protein